MLLLQGDCLELMKDIPDKSIDMILCDLPYGLTNCEWDKKIPFEPLWEQYNRIAKDNAPAVLFSQMPFTVDLVNSNRKFFRYEWIYHKTNKTGFLNANRMPLKTHENILVFYKRLPVYNPQFSAGEKYYKVSRTATPVYNKCERAPTDNKGARYPVDIIKFDNSNLHYGHPTQKPVDLCEYLIKTYTNEGMTVLDNCMGTGSTGVACVNTGRDFIGFELDKTYFEKAQKRINEARKDFENDR